MQSHSERPGLGTPTFETGNTIWEHPLAIPRDSAKDRKKGSGQDDSNGR